MPTFRLNIEYLGTEWHGWQIQPDHPTIQGAIESALRTAMRQPIGITGSGRTDTGVHASGQVAHLSIDQDVDEQRLLASLNGLLPGSIAIRSIQRVRDDFHARFDAGSRQYRYRMGHVPFAIEDAIRWFVRPAPDMTRMNRAASLLLGRHDFTSFCRTQSETENRVCTIETAGWMVTAEDESKVDFVVRADRFLHGMVRAIVGTLVEIGQGKRDPDDITAILAARDRKKAGFAAPARGLMLEKVLYPDDSPAESDHPG